METNCVGSSAVGVAVCARNCVRGSNTKEITELKRNFFFMCMRATYTLQIA